MDLVFINSQLADRLSFDIFLKETVTKLALSLFTLSETVVRRERANGFKDWLRQ